MKRFTAYRENDNFLIFILNYCKILQREQKICPLCKIITNKNQNILAELFFTLAPLNTK